MALVLLATPGTEPAFAGACPNAGATINEASSAELRKAVVCLINRERAQRDRRRLDPNGKLSEAAERHNKTMLEDNCWEHKCPGEPGLEERIRRTGYLDGAREWGFAENFGCATTPTAMVEAWMNKKSTRRNIKGGRYEDVGANAVKDTVSTPPSTCAGAPRATYTVVFAFRRG